MTAAQAKKLYRISEKIRALAAQADAINSEGSEEIGTDLSHIASAALNLQQRVAGMFSFVERAALPSHD